MARLELVEVKRITVASSFRKDLGRIEELAASIQVYGSNIAESMEEPADFLKIQGDEGR